MCLGGRSAPTFTSVNATLSGTTVRIAAFGFGTAWRTPSFTIPVSNANPVNITRVEISGATFDVGAAAPVITWTPTDPAGDFRMLPTTGASPTLQWSGDILADSDYMVPVTATTSVGDFVTSTNIDVRVRFVNQLPAFDSEDYSFIVREDSELACLLQQPMLTITR